MNNSNPIGVFDSGVGGLTVVKKISSLLPNENIIYFGDTARVPYGTKSNDTVIEYAFQDARFLLNKNVKMIVVACNTASSVALKTLQDQFSIPVIGMIKPGTKLALQKTNSGRIGIIGTNATINNKAYSTDLLRLDSKVKVYEKACPLFVPLAEEGLIEHTATRLIAEEYLSELKGHDIDTLILGCTHYPILAKVIQEVVGDKVELIDSGTAASYVVRDYLKGRGLLNKSNSIGFGEFYVSDLPKRFKEVAERFLGRSLEHVHKIDLDSIHNL